MHTDALHTARLLNVEERPFARVSKRLLSKDSLLRSFATQLPTPPPEESAADREAEQQKQEEERRQWREDVMLDFAALESTFIRIQFLKDSNEKERQRYAAEKVKILETAQAVRDNTAELRVQLDEAQKTLALRKEYDQLAEKITNNRMLKSRDEQRANLEKLNAEIADLERKLGLKKRKSLPKAFEDDGLGELLEDLDDGDGAGGEGGEVSRKSKRKAEADEWLAQKRRKALHASQGPKTPSESSLPL